MTRCLLVALACAPSSAWAFVSPGYGPQRGGPCRVPLSIAGSWVPVSWRINAVDQAFLNGSLEVDDARFTWSMYRGGGGFGMSFSPTNPRECDTFHMRVDRATSTYELYRLEGDQLRLTKRTAEGVVDELIYERPK
jgi:hypothetical protein